MFYSNKTLSLVSDNGASAHRLADKENHSATNDVSSVHFQVAHGRLAALDASHNLRGLRTSRCPLRRGIKGALLFSLSSLFQSLLRLLIAFLAPHLVRQTLCLLCDEAPSALVARTISRSSSSLRRKGSHFLDNSRHDQKDPSLNSENQKQRAGQRPACCCANKF